VGDLVAEVGITFSSLFLLPHYLLIYVVVFTQINIVPLDILFSFQMCMVVADSFHEVDTQF